MLVIDALSAVHGEQGFLIIGCCTERKIGEIITQPSEVWDGRKSVKVPQPVEVIGIATFNEFLKQNDRIAALLQVPIEGTCFQTRFYKVRALD